MAIQLEQERTCDYVMPRQLVMDRLTSTPDVAALFSRADTIEKLKYITKHREYRADGKKRKISQYEIGRRLGVSNRMVRYWFKGICRPNHRHLLEINIWYEQLVEQSQQSRLSSVRIYQ